MGGSDGRAAAELALEGDLEAFVAEGTLLLYLGADLVDLMRENLIKRTR